MRQFSFSGAVVASVLICGPALADVLVAGEAADTFELRAVASNLGAPTSVDWLPDGRMIVTEKNGSVILVDGGAEAGTQRGIGTFSVNTVSEQGLLHVLVHPDFATNRLLIFYYSASASAGGTNVDRHRVVTVPLGDDDLLDLSKEVILLRGLRGPANHDGGALAIGPDGKLYVGVGDTGCNSGRSPEPLSPPSNYFGTCLTNANGKILRINLDGSIPSDNPLVGVEATACGAGCGVAVSATLGEPREEIWAWGFRNPWRFWFDPKTDNLWVGDVGEVTYEEIDVIPKTGGGKHYGWPWREGAKGYEPSKCSEITPSAGACVDPQYYCLHNGKLPLTDGGPLDSDCGSITGGVIVDSCQFPAAYRGKYFFADAGRSWVSTLTPTADRSGVDRTSREKVITVSGQPVDVAIGPDGALYYAVIGTGVPSSIQRLFPRTPEVCEVTPEAGAPADAGVDASEPSTGGQASTGGSGNTGGRSSSGGAAGGAAGVAKDGGGGDEAAGSSDDGGCDCRVGKGGARADLQALAGIGALAGALALVSRRRRRRSV